MQEQHGPPLGDKFVCRHSPEINTQEGKHPSRTPVGTRSTCKHPPRGRGRPPGMRVFSIRPTCSGGRKSRVGLCCTPKSGDTQGERTSGVRGPLRVELAAAFEDAQSISLLRPQSAVTPRDFARLRDAVIFRLRVQFSSTPR